MILIKNAAILTQDEKRRVIKNGAILIKGDKIQEVGRSEDLERRHGYEAAKIIDGKNQVVMPGLINTHTHLAMTLLRGYADDLPLEEWWFQKVYPQESKFTKDDVYWGSLLGGLEMVKSGTTFFVDFYYFPNEVTKAVREIGIRANLGLAILDTPTFAYKNTSEILKEIINVIEKYENDEFVRVSLSPHMLQTTPLEIYEKSREIADKYGLILQTHLAETKQEAQYSLEKYGQPPAKLLIEHGVLDGDSLAVHCCHLNDEEIELLAQNEVKVAHCPISNMKLASGIMPLSKLLDRGVTIGLGTDSACSNNNLDMFEEMKVAALLHKSASGDPASADAQTVLDMATINAAKALKMEKQIGSIEVGKKADVIMLDFNQPHLTPAYNIVSNLVYAANGSDVQTVIINGKIIMENRRVLTVDEKEILKMLNTECLTF